MPCLLPYYLEADFECGEPRGQYEFDPNLKFESGGQVNANIHAFSNLYREAGTALCTSFDLRAAEGNLCRAGVNHRCLTVPFKLMSSGEAVWRFRAAVWELHPFQRTGSGGQQKLLFQNVRPDALHLWMVLQDAAKRFERSQPYVDKMMMTAYVKSMYMAGPYETLVPGWLSYNPAKSEWEIAERERYE